MDGRQDNGQDRLLPWIKFPALSGTGRREAGSERIVRRWQVFLQCRPEHQEAIAKFAVPLFFLTAAVSANAVPPAIT
jgi:hypothetical protein